MKNRKPTVKSLQNRIKALEKENEELQIQMKINLSICEKSLRIARVRADSARQTIQHFRDYSDTVLSVMP